MCNEQTIADLDATLAAKGISRRDFAALGAVATLALATPAMADDGGELSETMVSFATADGTAEAFFVHPAKGKHPGVVMWPDIGGLRDAYKVMGRRLAAAGYAVLVVNQYYRSAKAPVVANLSEFFAPGGREKLGPYIAALDAAAVVRDGGAYVDFLDAQAAVDTARRIGSNGYCMGGPFTVRTAFARPERVGAACSFHGGGLVTPAPDSPHQLLKDTKASYLFAVAQNDDARAPTDKDELRKAADAAGRKAEIEVYPADHGWCTIDGGAYNQVEADRAWGRMLAFYAAL